MKLGNLVSSLKPTKLPNINRRYSGDDEEDTIVDPVTGRRLIKKDPSFVVHVRILETNQVLQINCGRAKQKVSWLAMAAAQRTMLQQPHGRNRQRENYHVNGGVVLPGNLKDSTGRTINPNIEIRRAFADGDHITMGLGARMTSSHRPTMPVGARGRPQMARFTQLAYPSGTASRAEVESVKDDKYIDKVDAREFAKSALARKIALKTKKFQKKQKHNETLAAQFRLVMRNQGLFDNAFGLMTESERQEELGAIIGHEWDMMNFSDIDDNTEEEEKCKQIISNNIGPLSDMFRYYCGLSRTTSISTMSFSEFETFCGKCAIPNIDRQKLCDLFAQVNKEDPNTDVEHVNPDEELMRYEFLEFLIRLGPESVKGQHNGAGVLSTSEALESLLTNHVLKAEVMEGSMAGGGTCKVRAGMREHAVQAMFQQKFEKLYTVFKRYVGIASDKKSPPLKAKPALPGKMERQMSASAMIIAADTEMLQMQEAHQALGLEDFLKLLRDCAVITEYRSQEHLKQSLKEKELAQQDEERKRKALHSQYRAQQAENTVAAPTEGEEGEAAPVEAVQIERRASGEEETKFPPIDQPANVPWDTDKPKTPPGKSLPENFPRKTKIKTSSHLKL